MGKNLPDLNWKIYWMWAAGITALYMFFVLFAEIFGS